MADDIEQLPDPLDDPENHALMEKLFSVAMDTADEATRREMEPYVSFVGIIGAALMEATEGMTKDETKTFLDRWAQVVIERQRNGTPKLQ